MDMKKMYTVCLKDGSSDNDNSPHKNKLLPEAANADVQACCLCAACCPPDRRETSQGLSPACTELGRSN